MNPDAPFAASRFIARPPDEVATILAGLAERGWAASMPAGRLTLARPATERHGGGPLLRLDGTLSGAAGGCAVGVEVALRPCGDRATELLLRLRWLKAVPLDPAHVDADLLLASLAMDRLAADVATACVADRSPTADATLVTT